MRAMKAKRRGSRTISSGRATKYQPVERGEINISSGEEYFVLPQQTTSEQTVIAEEVSELSVQEETTFDVKNDVVDTETNASSYELYKHMTSFPLNMGVGTEKSVVLETSSPSVEDDHKGYPNSTSGYNDSGLTGQELVEATPTGTERKYCGSSRSDNESISGTDTSHSVTTNQVLIGSIVNIKCDQVDELDKIVNSNVDASQDHDIDQLCDELSNNSIESSSTTEFVVKETPKISPRDQASIQSKSNNNPTESANEADTGLQEDVCSSHLVVLLSNGVANSTHAVNQTRALKLLDDLQLPYQVVDGMDTHQLENRDELFSISGIRGDYPQIFISEVGQQRYLGGYDWFAETIADITGSAQGTALLSAVGRKEEYFQMISQSIDQVKTRMIVLISNGVADYLQKANQKSAIQLLTDLNIRHRIVDGMDSNQADERNELFKISGVRGQYPQLFASDENSNQTRYLGGYDWLESQSPMDLATYLE